MHYSARLALCVGVFIFGCSTITAQTPQAFPKARLIVSTADTPPRFSRVDALPNVEPVVSTEASEIERHAFDDTNRARLAQGLVPLKWDGTLYQIARRHSEDMVKRGYFDHETPDGLRLRDRALQGGIVHFRVLAENIAYNQGFKDPGAFAVQRWLVSPGHRANILNSEFEQGAVGSFVARDGTVYLTEIFIKR